MANMDLYPLANSSHHDGATWVISRNSDSEFRNVKSGVGNHQKIRIVIRQWQICRVSAIPHSVKKKRHWTMQCILQCITHLKPSEVPSHHFMDDYVLILRMKLKLFSYCIIEWKSVGKPSYLPTVGFNRNWKAAYRAMNRRETTQQGHPSITLWSETPFANDSP